MYAYVHTVIYVIYIRCMSHVVYDCRTTNKHTLTVNYQKLRTGDLVKLDVAASQGGFIGDTTTTNTHHT